MTTDRAVPQSPTLDGEHLRGVDPSKLQVVPREISRLHEAPSGQRAKDYHYAGATLPVIPTFYDTVLTWDAIGKLRRIVEELLATAGTHQLILWRHELVTWVADGFRAEFEMPRRLAVDVVATVPDGGVLDRYFPEVRVGRTGTPLTYVPKASGAYAGDPASDEAWFLQAGRTFKLAAPPAAGAIVFCWCVPVFTVLEAEQGSKELSDPLREPRRLNLVEAGED